MDIKFKAAQDILDANVGCQEDISKTNQEGTGKGEFSAKRIEDDSRLLICRHFGFVEVLIKHLHNRCPQMHSYHRMRSLLMKVVE